MIKVINISSMTVTIMRVQIKPKKIHIFETVSMTERARIASLCAVGKIKAYEIDNVEGEAKTTVQEVVTPKSTTRRGKVTTTNVTEPIITNVETVAETVATTEAVQDNIPNEEKQPQETVAETTTEVPTESAVNTETATSTNDEAPTQTVKTTRKK